jgi:hypothetical protein
MRLNCSRVRITILIDVGVVDAEIQQLRIGDVFYGPVFYRCTSHGRRLLESGPDPSVPLIESFPSLSP